MGDRYQYNHDPACYPDTTVLINLAGLHDQESLDAFEMEMVALRTEEGVPAGTLSTAHYREIHRHLFQDVYLWAGAYRTIHTGKGGNWFCLPDYIEHQMEVLFQRLAAPDLQPGSAGERFIPALANFIGELNAIHPFREGNGRTQLVWVRLLGQRAGHLFRTEAVEADEFLAAMIASYSGSMEPLIDELERMLA